MTVPDATLGAAPAQMTRFAQRGWCPSLHEPMATGDGLLVRVKPPSARLSSDAARALADAAARFGNGVIELTRRGNLQVRGLSAVGVPGFAAAMVAAGLADPDPDVERRRIVMPPPLAGDDPTVAADALALAEAIEAIVPAGLPPKVCIAVDGGGVLAGTPAADIVISVQTSRFAGIDGTVPAVDTVALVQQQLLAMAGKARGTVQPARAPGSAIGFHRYAVGWHGAFGLGLPFGQTDPAGLRHLADLADRFSEGAIRTSPWRAMLLGRVRCCDVPALQRAAAEWVIDPADPRLGITACVGSPGCDRATVPARLDAAWLAARGAGGPLHISGCAKGCAYSGGPALVGAAGRYSRVDNWRAGTTPAPQGLTLIDATA